MVDPDLGQTDLSKNDGPTDRGETEDLHRDPSGPLKGNQTTRETDDRPDDRSDIES